MNNGKPGQGTHSTKMGADFPAKNTPYALTFDIAHSQPFLNPWDFIHSLWAWQMETSSALIVVIAINIPPGSIHNAHKMPSYNARITNSLSFNQIH